METGAFLLFLSLALVSEILGTISGFGSSILFVPLAGLFFDLPTVLALTASFHVFSNIIKLILFKRKIDLQILLRLGIPATLLVIPGALLTNYLNQELFEILFAVILILLSITLVIFSKKALKQNTWNLISGGALSGFLAGLIGTGGSIRGLVLTSFNLEKQVFITTSAAIDLGVDVSRTIVYFANGFMEAELLFLVPALIVISFLGNLVGKKIIDRINQHTFRWIVLSTIIGTSIYEIVRTTCF